jgi:hypothetical protein
MDIRFFSHFVQESASLSSYITFSTVIGVELNKSIEGVSEVAFVCVSH